MISAEEFVERLCRLGAQRGPRGFPRRRRDRQILTRSVVMLLDSGRSYTEREINAALRTRGREVAPEIETDHVSVRRLLVDSGHLERTADGRAYRVGFPASDVAFALEVDLIDPRATIAAYRERRRGTPASAARSPTDPARASRTSSRPAATAR